MNSMKRLWTKFLFPVEKKPPFDFALLLLRVGFGLFMIIGHGWGKISAFSERAAAFADPLGIGSTASLTLAGFAEFFCSVAIILGLMTRLAALPLITTMLVAIFAVHLGDPFARMEKALLYVLPYFALLIAGPGRFSLDAFIAHKINEDR